MNQKIDHFPKGWIKAKIEEISLINPKYVPDLNDDVEVSFLPMSNVEEESGKIDLKKTRKIKEVKRGYTPFMEGDILFAKITPCMENGKVAVAIGLKNGIGFGSTEFHVARPIEKVSSKYIFYFLVQRVYRKNAQYNMTGSAGQRRVPKSFLCDSQIPIPPVPEQHRIVAKIEELFSSLDKGIETLKTAHQQLKVYRQAVLKWAFEGKLTNENVVDGELPEGWKWVDIGFFLSPDKKGISTGPFGTMLKKSEHQNGGVAVLGIENIGEGVFQMPNKIFITKDKAKELNSFRVKADDIIISRSGTVGEICLVPKKMENSIISTNLIKVSINHNVLNAKYFVYLFQGGRVRQQVFDLCKGSSRAFLNQAILKSLVFPYCPLPEQEAIVAAIESRLSVCDKIEESIEHSLKQAESLRQSILKQAFEGKLVPQDPNDEPANVLLTRIKAERESGRIEKFGSSQPKKARMKKPQLSGTAN
ncbi:MAG: restriction endonuclease subunit S [Pseudomonadota bacterium]